jgi:SAM-dependent methyltransferase
MKRTVHRKIAIHRLIRSRIHVLLLPIKTLFCGTKFDYYGWKTLKVSGTSSSLEFEHPRRDAQTQYLWNFIKMEEQKSVLEIGCLSGYRILSQAKLYPNVKFVGIDISQDAIATARAAAIKSGINNVTFDVYDLTSLQFFKDFNNRRFDVIFSFATLMYIHPNKIRPIIKFMVFNSNKKSIMIEQNTDKYKRWPFYLGVPVWKNPNWKRNYKRTCASVISKGNLKFNQTLVPKTIWSPGGGSGTVIEITRIND